MKINFVGRKGLMKRTRWMKLGQSAQWRMISTRVGFHVYCQSASGLGSHRPWAQGDHKVLHCSQLSFLIFFLENLFSHFKKEMLLSIFCDSQVPLIWGIAILRNTFAEELSDRLPTYLFQSSKRAIGSHF